MERKKDNKSFKTEFKEPTPIKKMIQHTKVDRVNHLKQIRMNKMNTTMLQKRGIIDKDGESTIQSINKTNLTALIDFTEYNKSPTLCVLVALNEEADLQKVSDELQVLFKSEEDGKKVSTRNNVFTGVIPLDIVKGKERVSIVCSSRSITDVLDYCKVADLIIFVTSSKAKHDCTLLKKDPYTAVNAIDDLGYETLTAIKSQGMLIHLAVIQDLKEIEEKYLSQFKKLYTRYLETELTPLKVMSLDKEDDYKALLRSVCCAHTFEDTYNLRKHRSYMLCDTFYPEINKSNKNETNLVVKGYIKGNTLNNLNYCHLTGFGDYIALEVDDEIEDPVNVGRFTTNKNKSLNKSMNNSMNQSKDINMKVETKGKGHTELNPETYTKTGLPTIVDDDFRANKLKLIEEKKTEMELNNEIDELIDFNIEGKDEDISFHDEDEDQEIVKQAYSKKHEAKTSLSYRTPDEMEVQDEIDTPLHISCKDRFSQYRGLSSMKTGSLDPLLNLPKEYSHIYSFENISHTMKEAIKEAHENGLRISGKYVKIILKNFKDFHLLNAEKPLVLSTLLNHERKLCVMHLKIKKREDYNEDIFSKQLIEAQIGFRRILTRPTFTNPIPDTDKLKKVTKLENGKYMTASLYSQLVFPEVPVIMLRPSSTIKSTMVLVATGKTLPSDSNKIILKRIVLTGYPLKIHKKRSVVRYMFFNPEDVNYFKPIPLFTKHGLRGNINESLGTHGYMKCTFSDSLKQNDTICLPLFKRCFPTWLPESWRLSLAYSNDPKYYEVFSKDKEEFQAKEIERYKNQEEEQDNEMVIEKSDL